MWLQSLSLFLLPCVQAITSAAISSVIAPSPFTSSVTIQWTWNATSGRSLRNITAVLISGAAEDKGNDVVDIIVINLSTVSEPESPQTGINYGVHGSTPPGPYHIRLSGTIFDDATNTALSTTSALSNTVTVPAFKTQCQNGTFVPVRSLTDPAYSPVRPTSPDGGDVFSPISLGNVDVVVFEIDAAFNFNEISNMTAEMINTVTGASLGVQAAAPVAKHFDGFMNYNTSGLSVPFGPYKIHTIVTSNSTLSPPRFLSPNPPFLSINSEEFFVMSDADKLHPDATCAMFAAGNLGAGGNSTGAGAANSTSAASSASTRARRPLQISSWGLGVGYVGLILLSNVWAGLFLG
ncbi:hypothetical protein GGX14DRAFT_482442 [Mycena pura]|uniref:Uncharacterized protein n=1 Tax=Mycena pura TaxID=153505 RepID=A0AAD6Y0B7_9AGAR|nr:hypothetical protein GGX14DRAFT_482442 [Mycena pura]